MKAYQMCSTISFRNIGSERYICRSRDRKCWSPDVTKYLEFWRVWELFSKPKSVLDAIGEAEEDERDVLSMAIEGMIECGLLESVERTQASLDSLLLGPLARSQPQSVAYHLSSSRVKWINYSNPSDVKRLDYDKMEEKVREEPIPPKFKKAANSTPTYDLAKVIPVGALGALRAGSECFGRRRPDLATPLTLDHLNFIINLSLAQTDSVKMYATGEHVRKAVPSGGARHPTEAYVIVGDDVESIEAGSYHYNVKAHRLDRLRIPRRVTDIAMRAAAIVPRARTKPVKAVIVHTCFFERSMFRYREARSYRVMNFDIGHVHANEILASKLLGLDFSECYSISEREIENALLIDPLMESAMSSFVLH